MRRLWCALAVAACTWIDSSAQQPRTFDLLTASVADIQSAVDAGKLTYEQLVQMYLKRIDAYDKDGGTGIRIGSAPPPQQPPGDGGGPARPAPNRMGAVASPDGKFIYYAERMGTFTYNARFPLWQIIRFDRETGDTSTITNAQGSAMRPVLSPDGKSLVFATRFETATGLRIRNLETGDERWLIYPVTRDDQESRASRDTMPGYAFTPGGRSLIVPTDGHIHRVDVASGRSQVIPFTAKVEAEIAARLLFENNVDDGPVVRAKLIRWPGISPDGTRASSAR